MAGPRLRLQTVAGAAIAGSRLVISTTMQVTVLQFNLNSAEGMSVDVDGYYGQGTRWAVMQVQRRYNLTPDGEYGPKTGHRMRWRAVNGSVSRWA